MLRRVSVIGLILAALAAGGCARSDTEQVKGRVVNLKLSEYKLSPLTTYVKPGPLTITARNDGKLAHNLAVIREGDVIVGRSTTINPGQTASIKISLDPGTYRVLSSLSNDDPLGINGYIVARK
jgi:plastocyanin